MDEERIREIVREEISKWASSHPILTMIAKEFHPEDMLSRYAMWNRAVCGDGLGLAVDSALRQTEPKKNE